MTPKSRRGSAREREHEEPRAAQEREESGEPGDAGELELVDETAGGEGLDETQRLRAERDELENRLKRSQADYQNLRRRSHSDAQAALRRNQQPMLEDLLLVIDHLDLALESPSESPEAKNLAAGVRMIRDQIVQVLEREGVEPVPEGGQLDPAMHEAVATVEDPDVEPGTIVETVRRGYVWRDTVLRFAHVRVATAPQE